MECKVIREKLSAYLEGEISVEERGRIEEHLLACPSCPGALQDLKKTMDLLKGLEEVEPPPWMAQKIMARIRREEGARRGLLRKLFYPLHVKIPIQAAATVLVAVIALYLFNSIEPGMKAVLPPRAPEQTLSRDEPSKSKDELLKSGPEPQAESPGSEGKPIVAPSSGKPDVVLPSSLDQRTDRGRVVAQGGKVSALEENEKRPEAPGTKGRASFPGAGQPGPAESVSSPAEAMKKESPAGPTGGATGATDAIKPQAMPPQPYGVLEREAKQKGNLEKDVAVEETPKGRTLAAPRRQETLLKEEMSRKVSAAPVIFIVRTKDVKTAGDETDTLLRRLGVEKIARESALDTEVFTAELRTEKAKDLLDNLSRIGDVRVEGSPADKTEESTHIRIEINSAR